MSFGTWKVSQSPLKAEGSNYWILLKHKLEQRVSYSWTAWVNWREPREQQRGTFREHGRKGWEIGEEKTGGTGENWNHPYFYKAEFHNEVFWCPLQVGQVVFSILVKLLWVGYTGAVQGVEISSENSWKQLNYWRKMFLIFLWCKVMSNRSSINTLNCINIINIHQN